MSQFSYLSEKIRNANFHLEPFEHLLIEETDLRIEAAGRILRNIHEIVNFF